MTFNHHSISLPISDVIPELKSTLETQTSAIISAPPGAGKSTILPLALLDEPWLDGKKIIMLEPRRLAARTIAMRMADLLNEKVGETVGYRIRFDNRISARTRIEVVTEGILTRMLQSDNALEKVGLVIFDEFHERSIYADIALVLCRESQQILRPDLRLVVMSATLDIPQLSDILKAPVVESKGRQYPVELVHTGQRDLMMLPEMTARVISQSVANDEGDILAFLPGEGEIRQCEAILRQQLKNISIHPLYGQLPPAAQMAAIMPHRQGRRKVVLATSIAETSLTIEGVSVVVDSGYGRTMRFDARTGLSRLTTIEISRDMADQRAGRAGRLGPGKCYRMWSLADDSRLPEHRLPEITESDLAPMVLNMAIWGITDIQQLQWPTSPPKTHVDQAVVTLHQLGALEDGKITAHGKEMAQLPCHPRLAHMLIMAQSSGHLSLATDLAAILEERDPMPRETGIDINLRIEMLRRIRSQKRDTRNWNRIVKVAELYHQLFSKAVDNGTFDPFETGLLLVHAYPERIASARPGNNAQFQLSNGSYVMASHTDDLAHEPWLAVAHMDAREGTGKIFLAAPLNPKDLAPMVKQTDSIIWDNRKGTLTATTDLRIGSIILQSRPLLNPDPDQITEAICKAIEKDGFHLLNFDEKVQNWQNRLLSLRVWNPADQWPDVSTTVLLKRCREWLTPYLSLVRKNEDLKKLDLLTILHSHLNHQQQIRLNQLAPTTIEVPSGSKININYSADGSAPVLAVRLQEMFGLADTPTINNGHQPVLLHLLSPGFKPVQVTSDLGSFWNTTYFEVRKELRNRYPRHVWPDDPWTEKAIRGVKRKK